MDNTIYTVDQAAEYLQLHPRTIRSLIARGELKAGNVGGHRPHGARYRIRKADADRFLDSRS
jgi:excisionase family DNA binding protein